MNFGVRPSARRRSSVVVELDLHHVGLERGEDRDGTWVGRRLGDDDVSRVDQRARDEIDHLLAPGRDQQVVGLDVHALGRHHLDDAVHRLGQALRRAGLQRLGARRGADLAHQR